MMIMLCDRDKISCSVFVQYFTLRDLIPVNTLVVWSIGLDPEFNAEDEKERHQLIEQVFELQNTLDGQL